MPEYKYQKEVRDRAETYMKILRESGYGARLLEHTFRDYTVKISIEKAGRYLGDAAVYYKPSQHRFTLGLHEMKIKEQNSFLEETWGGMDKSSFSSTRQGLQAYVDGSFYNGKIGYGAVILENGNVIKEFSKLAEDTSEGFEALHQIGGEIQSVYAVLDWAKLNNISEIEICFDYAGLEFWATGTWKAENSYAARYQAYIAGSPVKVLWRKVKGHSGDRWNERADKLAKQACENTSVDLVAEVAEKAKAFSVYLQSQNINACFDRIYNQMCARIIFPESSGKNFLDIYNTSKKRLDPKWNTIADEILLDQVKELWSRFQAGNSSLLNANNLEVSELQYKINTQIELLRTYKYLKFDFIDLAELVTMFQIDRGRVVASADQMRYDFDLIEETFLRLIEGDGNG